MSNVCIDWQKDQLRMVEALQKIAEDNEDPQVKVSPHSMPERASFIPDVDLLSSVGFESSLDVADSNLAKCLTDEDNNPPECIPYEDVSKMGEDTSLQVDENGSKVAGHLTSSPWMPRSVLLDISHSSSTPSCASQGDSPRQAVSYATVSAAAFTAAMIMESDTSVPKRPRSTTPILAEELDISTHLKDEIGLEVNDTTSSDISWEESNGTIDTLDLRQDNLSWPTKSCMAIEDPCSPVTPRTPLTEKESPEPEVQCEKVYVNHIRPELDTQTLNLEASKMKNDRPSKLQPYHDLSRDAALSKKRRAEAMERFRRKKAVRCYGRRVRYQIRKRIATTRPRVNGRFARKADVESLSSTSSTNK